MTTGLMMRRGDAMRYLGVGKEKFRAMVQCGALAEQHVRYRRGKPIDRALFLRSEVERIGRGGGK